MLRRSSKPNPILLAVHTTKASQPLRHKPSNHLLDRRHQAAPLVRDASAFFLVTKERVDA